MGHWHLWCCVVLPLAPKGSLAVLSCTNAVTYPTKLCCGEGSQAMNMKGPIVWRHVVYITEKHDLAAELSWSKLQLAERSVEIFVTAGPQGGSHCRDGFVVIPPLVTGSALCEEMWLAHFEWGSPKVLPFSRHSTWALYRMNMWNKYIRKNNFHQACQVRVHSLWLFPLAVLYKQFFWLHKIPPTFHHTVRWWRTSCQLWPFASRRRATEIWRASCTDRKSVV